jgi:hypothetical protein
MAENQDSARQGARVTAASPLSRRRFIRNAAVGAAGAAAMLGGASVASGAGERGEVTLDALLITYMSSALDADGTAWYELGRAYTSTLRLGATSSPDMELKAGVPAARETIWLGTRFGQTASGRVRGAITLEPRPARGEHWRFGSQGGQPEQTSYLGILRPRLQVRGAPGNLRFRFVGAAAEFIASGAQLQREIETPVTFRPETAESFLAQYVTDPAALVAPRFELRTMAAPPYKLTEPAGNEPSERVTATLKATILEQTGFESDALKEAFAAGNTLDVVYSSVQEDPSGRLMILDVSAESSFPSHQIYWDTVFKTFVIAHPNES